MAFNTNAGKQSFTATASQTDFVFNFKIFANTDIKVYQTPTGSDPDDTGDLLTLTTHYTVTIDGDNGGTISLVTGATSGDTIVIKRDLPVTRTTSYVTNGDLLAGTLNDDQEYQTYMIQDGFTEMDASVIKLATTDVSMSPSLPAVQPNYFLSVNSGGTAFEFIAGDGNVAALKAWEAEAEAMTSESYATKAEDSFVDEYTSDGDGTYTATPTAVYSALHYATKTSTLFNGIIGAVGNINNPLLDLPLNNSLAMKQGAGSVTFARASTATYIDRYGVLQTSAIDEPRFENEGLLIEGASTNLLLQSEDFSTSWAKSGSITIATNAIDAPDGTTTADKLTKTATSFAYISQEVTVSVGEQTASLFVKAGTLDKVSLAVYESSGTVNLGRAIFDLTLETITVSVGSAEDFTIQPLADGWYRITASSLSTLTSVIFYIYPDTYNATVAGDIYVWGAQLEELPFASSYIPTTTTAVTRAIDKCKVSHQGNLPQTDAFTIMADASTFGYYSFNRIFDVYRHSLLRLGAGSVTGSTLSPSGSTVLFKSGIDNLTKARYAISSNGTTSSIYYNGVAVDTELINAPYTDGFLDIYLGIDFNNTSNSLFGHISNFRIWDKVLTQTEASLA